MVISTPTQRNRPKAGHAASALRGLVDLKLIYDGISPADVEGGEGFVDGISHAIHCDAGQL